MTCGEELLCFSMAGPTAGTCTRWCDRTHPCLANKTCTALKTTKGDTKKTEAFIAALEAASFKGPGGDFAFDRSTHAAVQDIYIREVRASGGALVNAVVDKIASVKDPGQ